MIFIGCCIVLILLIMCFAIPYMITDTDYMNFKMADVLKSTPDIELSTGDILFFKSCIKCKYTDSITDDIYNYVYSTVFNICRWYLTDKVMYTHVGVIIKIDGEPYIYHIDGGDPMYDDIDKKFVNTCVLTKLDHINVRSGIVHLYKFTGAESDCDMTEWIDENKKNSYPSLLNLIKVNCFSRGNHMENTMACTDLVSKTLNNIGTMDESHTTLISLYTAIINHKDYDSTPIILKNKCYSEQHFI